MTLFRPLMEKVRLAGLGLTVHIAEVRQFLIFHGNPM